MQEKTLTAWLIGAGIFLATAVTLTQGIEMAFRGKLNLGPLLIFTAVVVLTAVIVLRWGYLRLARTGIVNFSLEFTQDEHAWSQAKDSLVYVGVTGFSITERFLAWYEKNRKKLPAEIKFYLVSPEDVGSLRLIASHRVGRPATPNEVRRLCGEVTAAVGKLQSRSAVKVVFYKITTDFIPVWMYVIDGEKIYLGFPPPAGTGMNSPAYLCSKRTDRYGLFDAYHQLLAQLEANGNRQTIGLQLAAQVVQGLRQKGLFITTVESCTGGGLANAISDISGASEVMMEAFVAYSNEAKIKLGVPVETIERHTVYSTEVAEAMAKAGFRAALRADIAVGITGSISRVDPANPNSQPGVVYIAVTNGEKTISKKFVFSNEGERWEVKERAIEAALEMVLEVIG